METIAPILQTLQTGETIYFYDPITAKSNILPSWRADAGLAVGDAPRLIGATGAPRPDPVTFSPSPFGYPTRGASYDLTSGGVLLVDSSLPFFVPDGYTFHYGAHGTATGSAGAGIIYYPEGSSSSIIYADLLSRTTPELTNISVSGPARGLFVFSGGGILNLSGLVAQILPSGQPAPRGNFIPGMGHSGVRIASAPQITGYSSGIERASVGLTVDLIEVGAWPR